ncbi:16752_t:CDS:2, partial [Funneliformis geosporum]
KMSSLPFESRKSASLICHLKKDVQGIVRSLKTNFSELQIKEYHGKSDPEEKAHDFSNVEESWKDLDLITYTSTLKIKKELFQWLLNAKRECLSRKLQNRGIFPDIDSIIWNKDLPTIRLYYNIAILNSEEEISDISNAFIVNHETAKLLENKPKKTLEEMRSLDQHHIVNCYGILSELLTEDASISNETAVETSETPFPKLAKYTKEINESLKDDRKCEEEKLAQIFGLDKQNAKVYSALFGENMALKKQLEDYHSQPNTLERRVKRLEKDVRPSRKTKYKGFQQQI